MSNVVVNPHRFNQRVTLTSQFTLPENDGYARETAQDLSYSGVAVVLGLLNGDEHNAFFWFNGVNIPPGAVIISAKFDMVIRGSFGSAGRTVAWDWVGEKTANPGRPTSYADYWSRPLTTAKVAASRESPYTDGQVEETENLAPIFQEIVNQPGWSSGNNINIFGHFTGGNYGRSWDDASPSDVRTLTVEYLA